MDERSSGIILRTRSLTETSLIVQWLTPDRGRIFTVAKGARRPKSPFLGKLDLFYEADFSFARSRRSELHNLREVTLRDTNAALREEIECLKQASYFVVLLEKSTEPEAPVPELHELLKEALATLKSTSPPPENVFVFELKLLCALGYEPELAGLSREIRHAAGFAMSQPFQQAADAVLLLDARRKQELNHLLQRAIGTALERVPPQRVAVTALR